MEYSFRYTREGDAGIVELAGEKDFARAREIWERILRLIANDCLAKMLVTDGMTSSLSEHHIFELGKWLSSRRFPRAARIAIVDPCMSARGNMNAFGETVLLNRGFYNIRVFPDRSEACAWLDAERRDTAVL